jgi:hypothetical protein
MKNSLKKLSMMTMLGLAIGSNLNATVVTPIKVINLPAGNSIAAQVKSGNSLQTPVNGYYNLDSDHTYYTINRTPATKDCGDFVCRTTAGYDKIIPNTVHNGSDFIGKKTWDIATNKIS